MGIDSIITGSVPLPLQVPPSNATAPSCEEPVSSDPVTSVYPSQPVHASIFSTENTFLSQSAVHSPAAHSPAAHTGNSPSLIQGLHKSLHLPGMLSASSLPVYANLSPTSQPIDLSTRAAHSQPTTATVSTSSHYGTIPMDKNGSWKDNGIIEHLPTTLSDHRVDDEDYDT